VLSRWSGVISGLPRSWARLCAPATASWALIVSLLKLKAICGKCQVPSSWRLASPRAQLEHRRAPGPCSLARLLCVMLKCGGLLHLELGVDGVVAGLLLLRSFRRSFGSGSRLTAGLAVQRLGEG